jgi:hypothetical protein
LIAVHRCLHVDFGTHPTKADHARKKDWLLSSLVPQVEIIDNKHLQGKFSLPDMTPTQDVLLIPYEHACRVMGCLQHVDPSQKSGAKRVLPHPKIHVCSLNTTRHVMDFSA